eukprot:scaffold141616_cov19-Tisochrysis_lutea.AAC.1
MGIESHGASLGRFLLGLGFMIAAISIVGQFDKETGQDRRDGNALGVSQVGPVSGPDGTVYRLSPTCRKGRHGFPPRFYSDMSHSPMRVLMCPHKRSCKMNALQGQYPQILLAASTTYFFGSVLLMANVRFGASILVRANKRTHTAMLFSRKLAHS